MDFSAFHPTFVLTLMCALGAAVFLYWALR